jgi:hypothetical protein
MEKASLETQSHMNQLFIIEAKKQIERIKK